MYCLLIYQIALLIVTHTYIRCIICLVILFHSVLTYLVSECVNKSVLFFHYIHNQRKFISHIGSTHKLGLLAPM